MTTELLLGHLTKQLRIPTIAVQYRSLARDAEDRNLRYEEFLLALLEAESREENQRQRRLKQAAFFVQKTLVHENWIRAPVPILCRSL
ncbi:ATP-binding protein [Neobacillus novalis]|uniref:ATP-binding protein n=1 Tax=Neobacillus novalis TaxID=220687 RepID=A0AA95SDS6_9BACI|nr:ATP-binding protein [Neobacillus novalis]WHY89174.1 ATP-binding protein [Neobacillus novalis]